MGFRLFWWSVELLAVRKFPSVWYKRLLWLAAFLWAMFFVELFCLAWSLCGVFGRAGLLVAWAVFKLSARFFKGQSDAQG